MPSDRRPPSPAEYQQKGSWPLTCPGGRFPPNRSAFLSIGAKERWRLVEGVSGRWGGPRAGGADRLHRVAWRTRTSRSCAWGQASCGGRSPESCAHRASSGQASGHGGVGTEKSRGLPGRGLDSLHAVRRRGQLRLAEVVGYRAVPPKFGQQHASGAFGTPRDDAGWRAKQHGDHGRTAAPQPTGVTQGTSGGESAARITLGCLGP